MYFLNYLLSISFVSMLTLSFYTTLLVSILVVFIMFCLCFLTNHIMGMGFSSLFCELMDSFVMWPMTTIVMSYILPGFEPLICFSFEEGSINVLNMSGQQWFWSYFTKESINYWEENFLQRSYSDGMFLFYTSTPCYFVLYQPMLIVGDSSDVMHSWGVPGLGIKLDLIPGHITLETFMPLYSGYFVGNCFEMCGAYHSLMNMNLIVI